MSESRASLAGAPGWPSQKVLRSQSLPHPLPHHSPPPPLPLRDSCPTPTAPSPTHANSPGNGNVLRQPSRHVAPSGQRVAAQPEQQTAHKARWFGGPLDILSVALTGSGPRPVVYTEKSMSLPMY